MRRESGERSPEKLLPDVIRKTQAGFEVLLPVDAALASYPVEGVRRVVCDDEGRTTCVNVLLKAENMKDAKEEVERAYESIYGSGDKNDEDESFG